MLLITLSFALIQYSRPRVWVQYKSRKSFYIKSLRDFSFSFEKHLRKEDKEDSQQEYDADNKQRSQALLGCEVGLHGL